MITSPLPSNRTFRHAPRTIGHASMMVAATVAAGTLLAMSSRTVADDDVLEARNRLVARTARDGRDAAPLLVEALDDPRASLRHTAAHLLAGMGEDAREALETALFNEDPQIRYVAVKSLERMGSIAPYTEAIVTDAAPSIRRYFFLHLMPTHLLDDGHPTDALIAALDAAYTEAPDAVRAEIVRAVAELPLTDASERLLRRAADREQAADAAEAGQTAAKALVALRALLEEDIAVIREMAARGAWAELIDAYGEHDLDAWPDAPRRRMPGGRYANEAAEAHLWRGNAYLELGQGEAAEAELKQALARGPSISHFRERNFYASVLRLLERNETQNLAHRDAAERTYGALAIAHASRLADAGRRNEALAIYRSARESESVTPAQTRAIDAAIEALTE